jgi:hypothetical protein
MYRALVNRDPGFEGIFTLACARLEFSAGRPAPQKNRHAKTSISLQHQATHWKTVIGLACDAIRSIQMRVRRN